MSGFHEEEADEKAPDAGLLRRLLRYVRPYRLRVLLAIALLLAVAALEVAGPLLTQQALDRAIPTRDVGLLTRLAALYFTALTLGLLAEYAQALLTTWLGQQVMYDLRAQTFAHLQRLDLAFFDRNPVGRLMTRVTNDIEALNELFSSGVVTVFGDVFTLLLIAGTMLALDWRLGLVTLAVLPAVAGTAFLFRTLIRQAYREVRVRLARINAFLQERISGVATVQLFGREADTRARFDRINRDHLEAHLRSITYYAVFFPAIELLTAVALALILWRGGIGVLTGAASVGTLAAFLQYARRFFRPMQDLAEKYNLLQGATAASERIFALLDTEPAIRDPEKPVALPTPARGEIEFRNVWFRYRDEDPWVLRGISFRAAPGQRLAVVGSTGAGKSTIIGLLLRFYEPERGQIFFDGVEVGRVALAELRGRIGLVLQDVFLFSQDVRANLALGRPGTPDDRLLEVASRVGADQVLAALPAGLDHPLGERGSSVSLGERQLLSFARALVRDPAVLVLDEATSSVDSELEATIEAALDALMRGRTALVVAHRLSTVRSADQILVLHGGEIREQGTHDELLAHGGLYAKLHALQFSADDAVEQHSPAAIEPAVKLAVEPAGVGARS